MGRKPKDFLDKYFEPSLGDELTIEYELNQGAASSGRGESTGRVMKVYEDDDGDFLGFKISVSESNHITTDGDAEPKIDVKAGNQKRNLNVYLIWPERRHKLNAVPGAVGLVEVNSFS